MINPTAIYTLLATAYSDIFLVVASAVLVFFALMVFAIKVSAIFSD